MPKQSLTFNGVRKEWLYLERGREESPYSNILHGTIKGAGMVGAHITTTDVDMLYVRQPVGFRTEDDEHEQELLDELKKWLVTDHDVEIQFDNVPGKTYVGRLTLSFEDYRRRGRLRSGTLVFLCKPYKYGKQEDIIIPDAAIVENKGTAQAEPIFELTATKKSTFAMVTNGNEYMMVGQPYDVDETPYERYERILTSNGNSLVGWTTADYVDGGIVSGTMETNGSRFQASDFGSGSSWHGPAIKRSLPQVLSNFRIRTTIAFGNTQNHYKGRIEMYLLDTIGNTIAKIAIKDNQIGRQLAIGEARVGPLNGGKYLISEHGDRPGTWNDFFGVLEIERDENRWKMYIAMIDQATGKHHARRTVVWNDTEGLYTGNVAQVVLHVGAVGEYTAPAMGFYNVLVDKINHDEGIPYIVEENDIIEFNHETDECFLNGEPVPFDFGADFFPLYEGHNNILVVPENTFETRLKFRERYK